MMEGSVRQNETFDTVVLVVQSGLLTEVLPRSVGGQALLKPAWTERVEFPHWEQYGFREFQSMTARPIENIAAIYVST
jgi:hypothetical protein